MATHDGWADIGKAQINIRNGDEVIYIIHHPSVLLFALAQCFLDLFAVGDVAATA